MTHGNLRFKRDPYGLQELPVQRLTHLEQTVILVPTVMSQHRRRNTTFERNGALEQRKRPVNGVIDKRGEGSLGVELRSGRRR